MPQPNLTQNPVYLASYWGFGVSKQSKTPAAAWNYIQGITQKAPLVAYSAANNLPSPRRDIIATQQNDSTIGVFAYQALNAKSFWKIDATQTDTIFTQLIDDVTLHGVYPGCAEWRNAAGGQHAQPVTSYNLAMHTGFEKLMRLGAVAVLP